MSYVLKNNETGKFVAPAGSDKSYTPSLRKARRFETRESAIADACGNETAVRYEDA